MPVIFFEIYSSANMKVVLVLVAVLAVALAEHCGNNQDCHDHGITNCGNRYHVVCDGNGSSSQCVCTNGPIAGTSCTTLSDCTCAHGNAHCIDSNCHCTRH